MSLGIRRKLTGFPALTPGFAADLGDDSGWRWRFAGSLSQTFFHVTEGLKDMLHVGLVEKSVAKIEALRSALIRAADDKAKGAAVFRAKKRKPAFPGT